jgi:hypothetical protein
MNPIHLVPIQAIFSRLPGMMNRNTGRRTNRRLSTFIPVKQSRSGLPNGSPQPGLHRLSRYFGLAAAACKADAVTLSTPELFAPSVGHGAKDDDDDQDASSSMFSLRS